MIFFDKAAGFWFREKAVTAQAVRTSSKKTQPKMWQYLGQVAFTGILLASILICCFMGFAVIIENLLYPLFDLPPNAPGLPRRGACRLCMRSFNQMSVARKHFQDIHLANIIPWTLKLAALTTATVLALGFLLL